MILGIHNKILGIYNKSIILNTKKVIKVKKKINAYQLTKVSSRMSKRFGVIQKGEEEGYMITLYAFETNLLSTHQKNPLAKERDAISAIQLCLLTLEGYVLGVEYDLEPFFTPTNQDFYKVLMMTFEDDFNDRVSEIVEEGDDLYGNIADLAMCLVRIEKSIKLWLKEMGIRGYFSFLERSLPTSSEKELTLPDY